MISVEVAMELARQKQAALRKSAERRPPRTTLPWWRKRED